MCGYRQWVTEDFKDPEPPEWLGPAKMYDGKGAQTLKDKTLGRQKEGKP
jgi:hypothetical protein